MFSSRATGALTVAIMLMAAMPGALRAGDDGPRVDAALRQQAVETLRAALNKAERWRKVHAAEYLIRLDYPQGVAETFAKELRTAGGQKEYRIGIWRVLAQAAVQPKDRQAWTARIRQVFDDPEAPDRLHAVESLAKLGYQVALDVAGRRAGDPRDESLLAAAESADGRMAAYARWVLVNSGRRDGTAWLAELLDRPDPSTRLVAAYALGQLPEVPAAVREKLLACAAREPVSPAKVYLARAAAVHAPPNQRASWKAALAGYLHDGQPAEQYQACETLAQIGSPEDIAVLAPKLEDADEDVRSAAAYALLRIDRRQPRHPVALDWCVMGLYAVGMLAVGTYYARRTATSEDYLLGARTMRPVSVGLSLFATMVSTISYLTWPGELIKYGPTILCMYAAHPLTFLVVGYLLIPTIMRLKVTSAYEILEARLGLAVRMLGSAFFLALRVLWMAVIIYATTAKVIVPLLGLDPAAAPYVGVILGGVTIAYTSMGGLRAVVLTDVIQTSIMLIGAVATLAVVTAAMGGVAGWWPHAWAPHWPPPVLAFDPDARITMLGVMLASFTWWVCTSGSDQMAIQRYLATRDAKAARRVLATSLVTDVLAGTFLSILGVALLAFFTAHPQFLPDGRRMLADADQLFPRFIVFGLPAALTGLVLAALLAAAMSSLSSGVNSSSSVILVDFLERFGRRGAPDEARRVRRVRWISVVIGVVVVLLSTFVGQVRGNLLELAYKIVNLLVAPLFGLFFMALFVRWAKGWATIAGAGAGLAVVILLNYWREITGQELNLFIWAMPLGFVTQLAVGSLLSLMPIGTNRGPVHPKEPPGP